VPKRNPLVSYLPALPLYDPIRLLTSEESCFTDPNLLKEESGKAPLPEDDLLRLETLDIKSIIQYGKKLLGSAGKQYDYALAGLDPAERLAVQKKSLTARLGLFGEYIEDDLIADVDVAANSQHKVPPTPRVDTSDTLLQRKDSMASPYPQSAIPSHETMSQTPIDAESGLSKRQLNQLKRKAKLDLKNSANKVRVVDLASGRKGSTIGYPQTPVAAEPHPIKSEQIAEDSKDSSAVATNDYFSLDRPEGADEGALVVKEFKGQPVPAKSEFQTEAEEEGCEWPYERLCDFLMIDLFDHKWEIRHGAAMGLREVIRVHGLGAGREKGKSRNENDESNRRYLNDLASRICCVFMLDRFGDWTSDIVVAPIRETVAQTLGALLVHLDPESVNAVYQVLHKLVMQLPEEIGLDVKIWEVCHGGMLGLKYLVAVRNDILMEDNELIDGVVEAVKKGLKELDDDVRAVSAATLIPIAKNFISLRPDALNDLMKIVWDCLSNLRDDLSASTGSVMDLLAKLCSFPEVLEAMKANAKKDEAQSFALLVPRLYPFLRHTITSVRSAVLRALLMFLDIEGYGTRAWVNERSLRLVFQNLLLEKDEGVLKSSLKVWLALAKVLADESPERFAQEFQPSIKPLMALTLHPIGVSRHPIPMDSTLLIRPNGQTFSPPPAVVSRKASPHSGAEHTQKRRRKAEKPAEPPTSSHNVDGHMIQGDIDLVGADVMIRSKITAAQAMGKAMSLYPADRRVSIFGSLGPELESPYSTTQLTANLIMEEYAKSADGSSELKTVFTAALGRVLENPRPVTYRDLVSYLQIVRAQSQQLVNTFKDQGRISPSKVPYIAAIVQGEPEAGPQSFSIVEGEKIVEEDFNRLLKMLTPSQKMIATEALNESRNAARAAIEDAKTFKEQRDVRIKAAAASALVAFKELPKKFSEVIKAMMDSVKTEENNDLQKRSAVAVASLIELFIQMGKKGPVSKIITNLVNFCSADTSETPVFHIMSEFEISILSLRKEEDVKEHEDPAAFLRESREVRIGRRGAKETLEQVAATFGSQLFEKVPKLKELIQAPIEAVFSGELPSTIRDDGDTLGQNAVDGLSTLRTLVAKFHVDLHVFVMELLPLIVKALQSSLSVFRYAAAKCFATICSVMTVQGMTMLVEKVIPLIGNPVDLRCRQGAIECIYHLIHVMEDGILPYVIFLIVPVLGRMSDSDNDVRLIATTTFAILVKLVPLEAGIPDPPGLSARLLEGRDKERKFISQMLDVHKVETFEIPVAINATLRSYQQEGVNWLAFLNRYHLHGILCDDMGLGKTLQTLCMVASDHYMRAEEFKETGAADARRMPSLIVCPPTLSGHWQQEIKTYAPFLTCVAYVGPPAERNKVRHLIGTADVVITSYEICRNAMDVLSPINFNYCVLDEGHLIKNPKAKTTIAVKQLKSNHRLILSGTPIQNNVLELWSLFDFLMPGFLGTEKVFLDRYAKPIAASRFSKSSSKEQEKGALAIEALHKQVLPFLLRRLKEEVLNDLPPKIIQNYYCDLSELQKKLFENFQKKEGKTIAEAASSGDKEGKTHIFQALQYMRKLCNTPSLVMNEKHKQWPEFHKYLTQHKTNIRDTVHAPKLTALRDLLVDCNIGVEAPVPEGEIPAETNYVSQHRALIFCQMKEMLDIVQNDVLKKLLPSVQYLRLDGSVPAGDRQNIVNQFNTDPSYDVLLLTTSVGGLGLNLTGADTVIFVEHDWNPQKDLQAMDRAHRIGQKKVVNVYRLITRGTLEEKILK
jgi:TATA-binding protein-associated factor